MLSTKGKKLLIVEEYTFRKDKETALGVSYRCSRRGCVASLLVDKSETFLLKSNKEHNHDAPQKLSVKVSLFEIHFYLLMLLSCPVAQTSVIFNHPLTVS